MSIHPSHFVSQCAPLMDKRVEMHGTRRADMNGKRGVAVDFHPMGGPEGDQSTWRRARELHERAIELGSSKAVENMQTLTQDIAIVRVAESHLTPNPFA